MKLRFAVLASLVLLGCSEAPPDVRHRSETTPLFQAVVNNDLNGVRNALAAGDDPNEHLRFGITPPQGRASSPWLSSVMRCSLARSKKVRRPATHTFAAISSTISQLPAGSIPALRMRPSTAKVRAHGDAQPFTFAKERRSTSARATVFGMTLRIALVALALTSLTGCPGAAPADAGRDARVVFDHEVGIRDTGSSDAFVLIRDDVMNIDAAVDAFAGDAFTPADAFASDAASGSDAPTRDARGAAAGMCNPEACTDTCLVAIRCVAECGGPVTECGCCACAAGSMDAASCTSSM